MPGSDSYSLILLRGLPGSGKSTLAQLLSEENTYPVYSIDQYFTDPNGIYSFDHLRNHLAYEYCLKNTREAMSKGAKKIIVANTFTMDWEMDPYIKMANEFGYRLFVCTVENYHGNENIHGIPDDQLKKMAEKYKVKLLS